MNYLTETILPIFYILIITAFVGSVLLLLINIAVNSIQLNTMNKKQLAERQKQYEKDSIDFRWFFVIIIGALLLTSLIENL